MGGRKINELPTAENIPGDDQFIVPIFLDTNQVIKKISVSALADEITKRVLLGDEIIMKTVKTGYGDGIKFRIAEKKEALDVQ